MPKYILYPELHLGTFDLVSYNISFDTHIGANLIPDSVFKPMSKNQNDDNDYLRLFSIVFFAVESDSGVKWSLKLVQGPKKEDLEA